MALAHAIALHGKSGANASDIIDSANVFHDYIVGEGTAPAKPAKAVKAAPPATKPVKPAKPAPAADDEDEDETEAEPDADEDDDEDGGVTKEHVGEALAALIDNDQKDDAIAILKKHGAKSLSSLDKQHYEKVKALADKKLNVV